MTRAICSRAWEAEAIEDGRLAGAERLSFERHASTCRVCTEEVAALARLRETMQHAPTLESAPLQRMRARASLLRRANELVFGAPSARSRRWVAVPATVLAVCALLLVGRWLWSSSPVAGDAARTANAPPRFEVTPIGPADWIDRSEGKVARLVLNRGTTSVHVYHLRTGQRFLLVLPDGELEVYGTRFAVEAEEQRTRRVEVTEGIVSLRLRGVPERFLRAGDRWAQAPSAVGSESPRPLSSVALEDQPARTPEGPMSPRASAGSRRAAETASGTEVDTGDARSIAQPGSGATDPASRRFAEAVEAFHAGAYAEAEARLDRFVREFPKDPRSEDAAFLRAVARSRGGDASGAARLAREYLDRFPRGLRRSEAERLLDAGTAGP